MVDPIQVTHIDKNLKCILVRNFIKKASLINNLCLSFRVNFMPPTCQKDQSKRLVEIKPTHQKTVLVN